jgi:hypothetical protein
MQNRDVLLQQRVRCITERFQERTANEAEPLSRERVREVLEKIIADLDEEHRRESAG